MFAVKDPSTSFHGRPAWTWRPAAPRSAALSAEHTSQARCRLWGGNCNILHCTLLLFYTGIMATELHQITKKCTVRKMYKICIAMLCTEASLYLRLLWTLLGAVDIKLQTEQDFADLSNVWQVQFSGLNTNTSIFRLFFFGEYEYEYIQVDIFWRIWIQIYLDPIFRRIKKILVHQKRANLNTNWIIQTFIRE